MRKEPVTTLELSRALERKLGNQYIFLKLQEECLELAMAIQKIHIVALKLSKVDKFESEELRMNLMEELSHVKVFWDLFVSDMTPDNRALLDTLYKQREDRLKLKL